MHWHKEVPPKKSNSAFLKLATDGYDENYPNYTASESAQVSSGNAGRWGFTLCRISTPSIWILLTRLYSDRDFHTEMLRQSSFRAGAGIKAGVLAFLNQYESPEQPGQESNGKDHPV